MKFISSATVVAALALGGTVAHAQEATIQGTGYQVGEATVLHPTVGAQTGFISNVFYDDATSGPVGSGLIRLLATLAIEPMDDESKKGGSPADMDFSAGLRLEYQEYLSGNSDITAQRNLGVGADLMLGVRPHGTFPITIEDHFIRTNRPTNFESDRTLSRDINTVKAGIAYKPEGRNISGRFHYTNTIDVFESDESSFANRILNRLQLGVDWQLLPITRFFIQGSYAFNGGLGSGSTKVSSNPIRGTAGVATAVTESITLRAHAGYAHGAYASGASFSSYVYHLESGYRYSPVGRVRLIFDRNFSDSINANFYGEYMVKLALDQQIDRVLVQGHAAAHLRNYQGVAMNLGGGPTRDDFILSAAVKASFELRDWLSISASYDMSLVETEFQSVVSGETDDPSYVRHQVLAGATAAF